MNTAESQNPPARWTQEFQVHSYEVDFRRVATLESICRYFLEAAWNHAELLGVGFSHLTEHGKLWVLSRLLVRIDRYPAWGETVTVRTWPRAARSVFAMRDFQLLDSRGAVTACGSSAWLVLDASTRRPQRVEKLLSTFPVLATERATDADPDKLPEATDLNPAQVIQVRYSDVDVNSHVNSCRYVGWMLDAYPMDFHQLHSVCRLEVNYLGETHGGDQLRLAQSRPEGLAHSCSIQKADNGGEVCRARLLWRNSVAQGPHSI